MQPTRLRAGFSQRRSHEGPTVRLSDQPHSHTHRCIFLYTYGHTTHTASTPRSRNKKRRQKRGITTTHHQRKTTPTTGIDSCSGYHGKCFFSARSNIVSTFGCSALDVLYGFHHGMVGRTMISRSRCSSCVTTVIIMWLIVLGFITTTTNALMIGHRLSLLKPKHMLQQQRCRKSIKITTTTTTMCSPFAPYFSLNRPFSGLVTDFRRRAPLYRQDWSDGFHNKKKVLGAIGFLYFACLAPTVAFGGRYCYVDR